MQIVIDTNIIVNALKSKDNNAKSVRLMQDVFRGKYEIGVSADIIREYREVLHRPHLKIDYDDAEKIIFLIEKHSIYIKPKPSTVEHSYVSGTLQKS